MMKEIGGYIELDRYRLPMLHDGAIALNCGRNALAYILRGKGIEKIRIPKFLCASVRQACEREGVEVRYYSVAENFLPEEDFSLEADEWLYIVNYYGQIGNDRVAAFKEKYQRIIVDNAQAYYQEPVEGVDTLYTCRKYFGVADGAFVYTDAKLAQEPERDESFDRMRFLLGRFERSASEFYGEYASNNALFADEPIKRMSKLTDNLLRGIDYKGVKTQRTRNFETLHKAFANRNRLRLTVPEGAFMYPLYVENGAEIRRALQAQKIYIPTLWPDVFDICEASELEYDMAKNILPIPVDQRYGEEEMRWLILRVLNTRNECLLDQ